MSRCIGLLMTVAAISACSPESSAPAVVNLQRPVGMAFTCFGDLRLTGGATDPPPDAEVVLSAQPVAACQYHTRLEEPPGQEGLVEPEYAGFILQPSTGSVAVVRYPATRNGFGSAAVNDADLLTPGKNAIPVGTLPVGIVTDPTGCHVMTANAGSCDLSVLEVNSAIDVTTPARITRIPVTAGGAALQAKPRAIVGEPAGGTIGVQCTDTPESLVYVAYPSCNLVAAIDTTTGAVQAGIRFNPDGSVEITDGNVTCANECANNGTLAGPPPLGTAERPTALHMAEDGSALYIGAENSSVITIVALDADRKPTTFRRIVFDGDVGVVSLRATGDVNIGGTSGMFNAGLAGVYRYVYAVTTDGTVRVAEVSTLDLECDTQVDPRYIHAETDALFLACMPVGDLLTPPRRAGAVSPGIQLPGGSLALDVAFAEVFPTEVNDANMVVPVTVQDPPTPTGMVGVFAFITATNGVTYVATVDDDNYEDAENLGDLMAVDMTLAVPHQLRDSVVNRHLLNGQNPDGTSGSKCIFPPVDALTQGVRLAQNVGQLLPSSHVSAENVLQLPYTRHELCTTNDEDPIDVPASEMAYAASTRSREASFPDLRSANNEQWWITWEGPISLDSGTQHIDGPSTRVGVAEVGSDFRIVDATRPFCAAGIEKYDQVQLRGCDPTRGDADCGLGETCFVHPESPTSINNGLCLPEASVDSLSGTCRDILISRRGFSVVDVNAGYLVLGERRRVLHTTPIDGCVDDAQCVEMARAEAMLASSEHPIDLAEIEPTASNWTCEADPTRAPGRNRCVMTCDTDADCESGWSCSASKRCVESLVPPAACMTALQRYQVRVTDAFAVVGAQSGFLHGRKADETTGACIDDPDAHPLMVGRLPLTAPPCTGDDFTDITPNPCSTTVEHTENYVAYDVRNGQCVATTTGSTLDLRTRSDVSAIRFQNPALRFHLVDPVTRGDAACQGDRAGTLPPFPAVFPGYQLELRIVAGFLPMAVGGVDMAYPRHIAPSPDGGLWVLDEGDVFVSGIGTTRGRVIRIEPTAANNGFSPRTLL